jgi:hypothetical protein
MPITAASVSTMSLTYTTGLSWGVFTNTNLATAGNLQANWTDIASQIDAIHRPLLNSAKSEINILEGVSGAYAIGMSGMTGVVSAATVGSSLFSLNSCISAMGSYGNIMTTTASQVMTNKLKTQNHSSYTLPYARNIILSTTAATAGAFNSGDVWFMYIP